MEVPNLSNLSLSELTNQYLDLFDRHVIISKANVAGIITYVNSNFSKISGYSSSELVGKNHRIIKSDLHPPELFTEMWSTIQSGRVWRGEVCNRAKDGSYYWVDSIIQPIKNADGEIIEFLSLRIDISERKKREQSFNSRYSALVEHASEAVYIFDYDTGIISDLNSKSTEMMGLPSEHFLHTSIYDLLKEVGISTEKMSISLKDVLARVLKGETLTFRWEMKCKDNKSCRINASFALIGDFDKNLVRLGLTDVTHEHQMQEEAKILAAVARETNSPVAILDRSGKVEWVNRSWCTVFGFSAREICGLNIVEFLRVGGFNEETQKKFKGALSCGRALHFQASGLFPVRNQEIVIDFDFQSVKGLHRDHRKFLLTGFDLSEQKRNQDLLEEQRAALSHQSKLSSLGEMAAGIAHEINNPLTIIVSYASVAVEKLKKATLDQDEVIDIFSKVEKAAFRISKIIRALRTLSRGASEDPLVMIEFNELIADVVELCGENIKHKGIELNIENADNLKILCRPTEIAQVLVNLLSNSIDALENSTTKKWIKISAVNGVGGAEILVEDSGSGITKEVASNLMRPFFTTKSPGKGTGLGLSISRAILESHGGSLKLDNPFSPTRFVLRFEPPQVAKAS